MIEGSQRGCSEMEVEVEMVVIGMEVGVEMWEN